MSISAALGAAAIAVAVVMMSTWIVSVARRDASIVDIVWGLGFVVVAWCVALLGDGQSTRRWVLVGLVSVWGVRLAGYLAWRNLGHGEDYRYKAMRKRWGSRFPLISLVTVFALQGVLMWVVSLPIQLGQVPARPGFGALGVVGIGVWLVGMFFETAGDLQLARFKADPANAGKVMDRGVWRYTRHPNYFGDASVWWGLGVIAVEAAGPVWARALCLLGPLVMTVLLLKVSGVAMLERSLRKRKPEYEAYAARTSAFVPRPPRSR